MIDHLEVMGAVGEQIVAVRDEHDDDLVLVRVSVVRPGEVRVSRRRMSDHSKSDPAEHGCEGKLALGVAEVPVVVEQPGRVRSQTRVRAVLRADGEAV